MRIASGVVGLVLIVMLQPALAVDGGHSEVNGKVWNPYGNLPCDSCPVTLESAGAAIQTTNTDTAGTFHFKNVHPGSYIIHVKVEGFQEVEFRAELTPQGLLAPATILLEPEPVVRNKPEPATVDVAMISEKFPKKAVELFHQALKDRDRQNINGATADLEESIHIAPNFFQAHDELGKLYKTAGRLDDAEKEFLQAKRLNESSADPLIQLSGLYVDRNQPDLAVTAGEEAIKKDSHSASAFFNLGLAFYRLSRLDNAENALKKALALAPSAGQIRLLLANVYLKRKDWSNVRAQLDTYLKENPNSPERANIERVRGELPSL